MVQEYLGPPVNLLHKILLKLGPVVRSEVFEINPIATHLWHPQICAGYLSHWLDHLKWSHLNQFAVHSADQHFLPNWNFPLELIAFVSRASCNACSLGMQADFIQHSLILMRDVCGHASSNFSISLPTWGRKHSWTRSTPLPNDYWTNDWSKFLWSITSMIICSSKERYRILLWPINPRSRDWYLAVVQGGINSIRRARDLRNCP